MQNITGNVDILTRLAKTIRLCVMGFVLNVILVIRKGFPVHSGFSSVLINKISKILMRKTETRFAVPNKGGLIGTCMVGIEATQGEIGQGRK